MESSRSKIQDPRGKAEPINGTRNRIPNLGQEFAHELFEMQLVSAAFQIDLSNSFSSLPLSLVELWSSPSTVRPSEQYPISPLGKVSAWLLAVCLTLQANE
jgi:hypothetical protein